MRGETTVVVGGGCSGVIAATAWSRHDRGHITIIDPSERIGPGVAYGTDEPAHLLNSRAGTMGIHPDDPAGFVAWCHRTGITASPHDFLPRQVYGRYLQEAFTGLAECSPNVVRHVRSHVTRLLPATDGGTEVICADGTTIRARNVVLALGLAPPTFPPGLSATVSASRHCIPNPWTLGALDDIPPTATVLLLGTGLTAVDMTLSLAARGHQGHIIALSRHGTLPLPHEAAPAGPPAVLPDLPHDGTLGTVLRTVRAAAAATDNWRAVIDGLRPHVNDLWNALTTDAKRRFLRHVVHYWEIHRHRMPPQAAAAVRQLRGTGALTLAAGRIDTVVPDGDHFTAVVNRPGQGRARWTVGAVVNCTGPGHPSGIPLVRTLVADGLARADRLHLGIDVDAEGRLVRPDGAAAPNIRVVGALRRGRCWETTGVPEIRAQADVVASGLGLDPTDRPEVGASTYS